MARKPETKLAEKWDKELKALFGKDLFIENIQQVTKIGTPDRLCCLNGKFVALEYKTEIGKPSKLQLLKIRRIERAGGYAYLVTPATKDFIWKTLKSIYGC